MPAKPPAEAVTALTRGLALRGRVAMPTNNLSWCSPAKLG
jgi:hypothetical protein